MLRFATPQDAPGLLEIYAPYVTGTIVSFEYDVPTLEEFARRILLTEFTVSPPTSGAPS